MDANAMCIQMDAEILLCNMGRNMVWEAHFLMKQYTLDILACVLMFLNLSDTLVASFLRVCIFTGRPCCLISRSTTRPETEQVDYDSRGEPSEYHQ